ncbi:MAG: YeeE/YedE family protein [Gammaproteobacteria bacterium]|uniref:YeeE/YedE family protein n=1 Tax=Candidatus Thiopontia autotrophica TaxID=2841688 RepID=A0A8J6PBF0_9GAMM|nr:YeeE/YedE family protein [Candidatus Thiopontia autotrophica]
MQDSWISGLRDDLNKAFVEEWSPYFGALALIAVVVALMTSGLFWSVYGGLHLWGNWFNELVGLNALLNASPKLEDPLMHRISLLDITLVLGAFTAALLSRQFRINRAPKAEYFRGAVGGILMGIGATLAGGCTVGGFFTPLIFSSPAGWTMGAGLLIGAFIGLKILLWSLEAITWGNDAPMPRGASRSLTRIYPFVGVLVFLLIIAWASSWYLSGEKMLVQRGIVILCGFALGFILHRSRFCFSRAIREPLMTGEGAMTKATILAIAVGALLASILFQRGQLDPYLAIPATFWLGSGLGGVIFGIGMILAGGCASGSLWRMGEGHLKLWVVVFFFAWSGATFGTVVKKWDLMTAEMNLDLIEVTKVGQQAFLPDLLGGWSAAYAVTGLLLTLWYVAVRYNETTEKFTVI